MIWSTRGLCNEHLLPANNSFLDIRNDEPIFCMHSPRSRKGSSYENKNRRRGRPAWQRSADDTPLRDGNRCPPEMDSSSYAHERASKSGFLHWCRCNVCLATATAWVNELTCCWLCRDRLIGLLTERAARTLLYYLSETNQHLYYWFSVYIRDNPIPRV